MLSRKALQSLCTAHSRLRREGRLLHTPWNAWSAAQNRSLEARRKLHRYPWAQFSLLILSIHSQAASFQRLGKLKLKALRIHPEHSFERIAPRSKSENGSASFRNNINCPKYGEEWHVGSRVELSNPSTTSLDSRAPYKMPDITYWELELILSTLFGAILGYTGSSAFSLSPGRCDSLLFMVNWLSKGNLQNERPVALITHHG